MWKLKNSKYILDNFNSPSFSKISSIQIFEFSTLYTTIPHEKKPLKEIIDKQFYFRNGSHI
jgi:hypothetical protein